MDESIEVERQIDAICNDYETQWGRQHCLQIQDLLHQIEPRHRARLLNAILDVDIELRLKQGSAVSFEYYEDLIGKLPEFSDGVKELIADRLAGTKVSSEGNQATDVASPALETEAMPGHQGVPKIPGFQFLREIGRGGMGTVWAAEQHAPLRRQVALKVVRSGLSSREVIARFQAERQALAIMDHENIARIFDGGLASNNQPWFAMELVDGQAIVSYCDKNRMTIEERLQLCIQVCNAVQHAHQKGIIHRDLKPSNVLVAEVDGQPAVKIIDFGLAKALEHTPRLTDESLATDFGQVLGTLQYMSPEQASSDSLVDVDTRADIYSIGIILCELLTGTTLLDARTLKNKSLLAVLETIRNIEIKNLGERLRSQPESDVREIASNRRLDPGQLQTRLSGDLNWILAKAVANDRNQRYQTASGLADDLQRYLHDEPILARPPSVTYQLRKFVHRHKSLVLAASLLLVSVAVGFAATYLQMRRAQSAELISESRRLAAVDATTAAEKSSAEAKRQSQLAFNTLFSVISDFQNGLKNVPGGNSIRRVLLNRSLKKLEGLTSEYIDQVAVARHSVIALNDLGDIALKLLDSGQPSHDEPVDLLALSFYQRGLEIANELSDADPEAMDIRRLLVASNGRLGQFYLKTGQLKKSEQYFDAQRGLIDELLTFEPNNSDNRLALASSYDSQGDIDLAKQNPTDALANFELARDIRADLAIKNRQDIQLQRQLSRTYIRISEVMLQLGRVDDGLQQLETAQNTLGQMIEQAPENTAYQRDLLVALERGGDIFQALRRYDQAYRSYHESLQLAKGLLKLEPANLEYMMTNSISHQKLGRLFLIQGELPKATEQYQQSIELNQAIIEVNPFDLMANDGIAVSLGKLGEIEMQNGENQKALSNLQQSMEVRKAIAERVPENLDIAKKLSVSYQRLGTYFVKVGELDPALTHHRESYKICKRLAELDPNNDSAQRFLLSNHEHLAIVFDAMDQDHRAVSELEKMVEIARQRLNANPNHAGVCHDYLYSCLRLAESYQTILAFDRASEVCREATEHATASLAKQPNDGIETMKQELQDCELLGQQREEELRKQSEQDN